MGDVAAAGFSRCQTQDRTEALTAGEKAIAHRLMNGRRFDGLAWQIVAECALHHSLPCFQVFPQIHWTSNLEWHWHLANNLKRPHRLEPMPLISSASAFRLLIRMHARRNAFLHQGTARSRPTSAAHGFDARYGNVYA